MTGTSALPFSVSSYSVRTGVPVSTVRRTTPGGLQLSHPLGEHAGAHRRDAPLHLAEMAAAPGELADDEPGPLACQHFERFFDR